jgi:hypothetical protein
MPGGPNLRGTVTKLSYAVFESMPVFSLVYGWRVRLR